MLAEFEIPATIFVPSRIIDGDVSFHWYEDPPPALSWDEVGELVAGGLVDVQSHTLTHPLLPQVDAERSYEEIAGSKRAIEAHVPYSLTSFCYPAGLYGAREVEFVRSAGYAAAVTTNPGVNSGGGELLELRRDARLRRRRHAHVPGQARRRARRRDAAAARAARAPLARRVSRPPSRRPLLLAWKEWARTRARDEKTPEYAHADRTYANYPGPEGRRSGASGRCPRGVLAPPTALSSWAEVPATAGVSVHPCPQGH